MKKEEKKINWKALVISFIAVHSAALIGSLATKTDTEWYNSVKPSITPPGFVFPIAWTTLFILISLSLYFAWTNSKKEQKPALAALFGINLFLNALWSILFFGMQMPLLAFIDIILIIASIIAMIIFTRRINKLSAYLLIPYLLWVSFASILNLLIVLA